MDLDDLTSQSAVDTIEGYFKKGAADLQSVERALASEFGSTYAKNINPYNLVNRVKQLEAELPILAEECQQLSAEKQDLIDTAKRSLLQSRESIRSMQARAGLTTPHDAEDSVYTEFKKILKEWNQGIHAKNASANGRHVLGRHELNLAVFQSKAGAHNS